MKKLTIVSLIFLSAQLFAQVNSSGKGSLLQLRNFERTSFSFEEKSQDSLPPISKGKIISEFLVGNIIGFGSTIPSLLIVAGIGAGSGENGLSSLPAVVLTSLIASPFAFAYGVYLIGNIGIEEGSYWSTFLGAACGVGIGVTSNIVLNKIHDNKTSTLYTAPLLCPSIGAIIGFNSSRKLETNTYSFKIEQNKYSILKPDFSMQLFRVNF